MQSTIHYALTGSNRFERDAHGRKGPPVGYDVYEITGHTQVGEVVFLTLKPVRWVRHKESLADMTKEP